MKNYANILLTVFIYFVIFCFVVIILGFLLTKKYNKKYQKIYTLFTGLNFKEIFLLSTSFINLVFIIYYVINSMYFMPLGLYMIASLNFLSCLVSLNYRVILIDIIYTGISCSLIWLLMTVYNYYNYVGGNEYVLILIVVFIVLIILYALFITIRKINLIINIHKNREVRNEQ